MSFFRSSCSTKYFFALTIPHLILFMTASSINAASVSLSWNANSESDLAGYKIYQRKLPSTNYGFPIFTGLPSNPNSPQITITNLTEGETYGFIGTAFDTSGNESSPTPEKQITISNGGGSSTFPPPMSSPAPGSTLTTSTVTFTGGHSSQDLAHWLYVGTSVGAKNLHDSGDMGTGHSRTVSGLPTTGTIYVRWYSKNGSGWQAQDHTFTMNVGGGGSSTFPPPMSSPAPGSTLTTSTVTFTGGHSSQDLAHWLYVGTSVGAKNLHDSGDMGTGHSRTVSGLPTTGTIYVRWYSKNGSGWQAQDHTFTMNVGGGGSSTFPPPMSSPAPGSTLTTSTVTFTGGHSSQDLAHWLYVGTSVGAKNLHDSGDMGTGHSRTVSGLPTTGTIYVRWYSKNGSGWQAQDHTFTMNVGGGGSSTFPPPMSSPAPGSTLTTSTVTFTGGHSSQDLAHWLYVGTSVGAKNLHDSGDMGTGHSRTVSGLPTTGTIYVRWYSKNGSGWQAQDHTFTMNVGGGGSSTFPPPMSSPAPGSTLTTSTVTFTGGHSSQDLAHWLYVGTSVGAKNLHDSGDMGTGHSRTVSGLPTTGTIYVRWYSKNGSGWQAQDHTFTMNVGGGGSSTFPPPMSSPAPGSTLTTSTVTFTGGHSSQDLAHWLYVGTSVGAKNLHDSGDMGTGHSRTVSGLPTTGTIYVRWYSKNGSGWQAQDHTFTMNVGQ